MELLLRFARENPSWGYDRIQGALANLGHDVSDQTVGNVLKHHGIEPAPDRKRQTTWKTFIKSRWDVLAAIDFTTIERRHAARSRTSASAIRPPDFLMPVAMVSDTTRHRIAELAEASAVEA